MRKEQRVQSKILRELAQQYKWMQKEVVQFFQKRLIASLHVLRCIFHQNHQEKIFFEGFHHPTNDDSANDDEGGLSPQQ